ncbi:ubiquitin-conjugating enzyme, partial [Serendipita vermifera]
MSMKRIKREILDLSKEDLGDIVLKPTERSMYEWTGSIPGPSGSPYAGGVFHLSITLPNEYPFSAPKILFTTPIYHPNVSPTGQICVDVLKNAWSPALSLYKVMLSISSLLTDPNPRLVPHIAQEYLKNRSAFDRKAREWTLKHATP